MAEQNFDGLGITSFKSIYAQQIRQAILNPTPAQELLKGFRYTVVVSELNLPRAIAFLDIFEEEIGQSGVESLLHMLRPHHPKGVKIHELQHVQKAQELGVNLSECSLRAYFISTKSKLTGGVAFDMPSDTDVLVKAKIFLAPQHLSEGDIWGFENLAITNASRFVADQEVVRDYEMKTRLSFYDILKRVKQRNVRLGFS